MGFGSIKGSMETFDPWLQENPSNIIMFYRIPSQMLSLAGLVWDKRLLNWLTWKIELFKHQLWGQLQKLKPPYYILSTYIKKSSCTQVTGIRGYGDM